ncbi:MAG: HD-GYP domain-containing protein, partial [Lachnospiraceae bacterium]|nr:HD-GYP domain-containing protein [Lachnospiraceae bacterium]
WLIVAGVLTCLITVFVMLYIRKKTAALLAKQKEQQTLINQVIRAFAKCIDMKDRYTNGHSFRVAKYTKMLAQKLGYSENEIENMYNIALLHDIGKISIPDKILNKTEGLDDEEYMIMKRHSANGFEVLKNIKIAPDLSIGAGYHHERLDGKGYPFGLTGEQIPMVAQVIAVADTFDAMYSTRPYRKKMELGVVIDRIQQAAGTQLNPQVVEKLMELADEGLLVDESVE